MRNSKLLPAAAVLLSALSGSAGAATATTSFPVSASVANNCLVSATNLTFAAYDGTATVDATSTVSVRCTKNTAYNVKLDDGNGNSFAPRKLLNGADALEYNLFSDSGRTLVWGETVGVNTVADIGKGMAAISANPHTVYGRVLNSLANQDAPVGSYADTINVTVEY